MTVRAQMPGGGLDGPELPVLDMDPDFDDLPLHGGQGSEDDAITQEAVLRLADAALCAVADAGFVIVPREPTEVMADEAAKEICRQQFIDPDGVTALAGGQHRNWILRRPVARATLRAAISEGAK